MFRLPQISGTDLIRLLNSLGYETLRQKGSHIRLRLVSPVGEHNISVPNHKTLAKGTLNDILSRVSLWTGVAKNDLIERLR